MSAHGPAHTPPATPPGPNPNVEPYGDPRPRRRSEGSLHQGSPRPQDSVTKPAWQHPGQGGQVSDGPVQTSYIDIPGASVDGALSFSFINSGLKKREDGNYERRPTDTQYFDQLGRLFTQKADRSKVLEVLKAEKVIAMFVAESINRYRPNKLVRKLGLARKPVDLGPNAIELLETIFKEKEELGGVIKALGKLGTDVHVVTVILKGGGVKSKNEKASESEVPEAVQELVNILPTTKLRESMKRQEGTPLRHVRDKLVRRRANNLYSKKLKALSHAHGDYVSPKSEHHTDHVLHKIGEKAQRRAFKQAVPLSRKINKLLDSHRGGEHDEPQNESPKLRTDQLLVIGTRLRRGR